MITEDFVSFETAKILKEKGFDEPCNKCFYTPTKRREDVRGRTNSNLASLFISAPTLQMAIKWLREKGIIITIDYNEDEECEENERYGFSTYKDNKRLVDLATYVSYEDACEAAISYCVKNLI